MTFIITAVSIFVAAAIGVLVLAVVLARPVGQRAGCPEDSASGIACSPSHRYLTCHCFVSCGGS